MSGPGNEPAPLADLLEDLCRRWRRGERAPVEEYLQRWPALRDNSEAVLSLLAAEVDCRKERGEDPGAAEYNARFPQFVAQVREVFARRPPSAGANADVTTKPYPDPPTPPPMPPPPGAPEVRGYEILAFVDRGGQGEVYKARQLALDRVVALKVLGRGAALDPDQLARFRREARLVASFDHPNIIRIHSLEEFDGGLYLSMEFADGGSLKARLAREGPPPPDEAAHLLLTLAHAVQHAHGKGVVHRDLKPSNILFTGKGAPKVADFGLAKSLDGDRTGLTDTHAVMGTVGYMAPEQAAGRSRDVGPATDVYALGAILYELLTGRPPFVGESWLETLDQIRFAPAVPPSRRRPGLPPALEQICLTCLAKEPADRYPSSAALAEDLGRFLAGGSVEGVPRTLLDETLPEAGAAAGAGYPVIPGYEILGELGRGGMGKVYKARQISLRRLVALKLIRDEGRGAARWRRLFRGEAWALARLNHPNIVQAYDLGEHEGLIYVAMEFMPGGSLAGVIHRVGQLPPRKAAELVEPVAWAAEFFHSRGLIHRDLKPANILLAPAGPGGSVSAAEKEYGTPKITDFGLVRHFGVPGPGAEDPGGGFDDGPDNALTMVGEVVGTPAYMSPEQASGRHADTGPPSDVWSLGVILYELLTGRGPFLGGTAVESILRVLQEEPPPPRGLRPEVPRDLEAVCLKCLKKDAGQRYASGGGLAADLRAFLDRSVVGPRPPRPLWRRVLFWRGA
jgi:serine/threonine protein kinase